MHQCVPSHSPAMLFRTLFLLLYFVLIQAGGEPLTAATNMNNYVHCLIYIPHMQERVHRYKKHMSELSQIYLLFCVEPPQLRCFVLRSLVSRRFMHFNRMNITGYGGRISGVPPPPPYYSTRVYDVAEVFSDKDISNYSITATITSTYRTRIYCLTDELGYGPWNKSFVSIVG